MNKILSEELLKKEILTEKEINLLKLRLNKGEAIYVDGEYRITPEQTKKGLEWLMNKWKSPRGVERKNNPFGNRETAALENFSHFTFEGFADIGNQYRSFAVPIYGVHGKDGEYFQYHIEAGNVSIIG
jgi:hypothetical protein